MNLLEMCESSLNIVLVVQAEAPGGGAKIVTSEFTYWVMSTYLRKSAPTCLWSCCKIEDAALAPSTYLKLNTDDLIYHYQVAFGIREKKYATATLYS